MAYTWQNGRQLQKMQKNGETVEFVYNENGLRVQKTATTTGATKYTLHGKNIVHMTQGNNELHFFYDAQNKPAVIVYNGTPYSYVKNLQGDIVAILDSNKNVVVSYVYDAWGRPISKTGSMAGTLGTVQPFRYRGYVYDEETKLFYLRSRYYETGHGRFINTDDRVNGGALLQVNVFAYCGNTYISRRDDNGYESESAIQNVIGKTETEVRYVDITDMLDDAMVSAYVEMYEYKTKHPIKCWEYFINNVKTNGKWDLKNREEWKLATNEVYVYRGMILRNDEPGNILFGFVGSVMSGELWFLQAGAGVYQIASKTAKWEYWATWFDDPVDARAIAFGSSLVGLREEPDGLYVFVDLSPDKHVREFKDYHKKKHGGGGGRRF